MTDEALTAPPEPLVPMAVTHAPTARLLDVVDFVSRTLVVDARATVTSDAELLVEPAVRLVPSTVSESPETDTTLPVTNDPLPALANPPPGGPSDGPLAGALPVEAPSAAPLGGVPPPAGGPPVPGPAVAGPAVVVQAPDEDGEETVTDWAVILPPAVVPLMATQSPAASDEAVRVTVWRKAVESVQVTLVSVEEEPFTSMD